MYELVEMNPPVPVKANEASGKAWCPSEVHRQPRQDMPKHVLLPKLIFLKVVAISVQNLIMSEKCPLATTIARIQMGS